MMEYLSVKIIHLDVGGDFWLPLITIHQEFFFVVKKFFVSFSWVFKVWSFNDGIDWKMQLFHVSSYFITHQGMLPYRNHSKYTWSCRCHIWLFFLIHLHVPRPKNIYWKNFNATERKLHLNGNGLSWTCSFAEFAGNTSFFTSWISNVIFIFELTRL